MEKSQTNPCHIGFIVDGNRRWAKAKNLPILKGHQQGLEKIEMTIAELAKTDVKFASFYIFSTENWRRPPKEIDHLMRLAKTEIKKLAKKLAKNNVKCLILGAEDHVDPALLKDFQVSEQLTKNSTGLTVAFCFNYGGQQEIIDTAQTIAKQGLDFTIENFNRHLYHPEIPPLDLIVRTSGEQRLSGFMLWRSAYAELLFLTKNFPDLEPADIKHILQAYQNRSRRFGE